MANPSMKLDDFFAKQSEKVFKATIERIENNDEHVKVTPWLSSAGCLCHLAINIPKSSIESVSPTGDKHECCGKSFLVVEINFAKGSNISLNELFTQLNASSSSEKHQHGHHHHEPHNDYRQAHYPMNPEGMPPYYPSSYDYYPDYQYQMYSPGYGGFPGPTSYQKKRPVSDVDERCIMQLADCEARCMTVAMFGPGRIQMAICHCECMNRYCTCGGKRRCLGRQCIHE